jgi:hypothetical protein
MLGCRWSDLEESMGFVVHGAALHSKASFMASSFMASHVANLIVCGRRTNQEGDRLWTAQ